MISREPTIERLAVARPLLLEPFGLDEAKLAQALATIATHRIDDADLYFQYTRSEGWSLEEGIVKTGSFSIDQGVGVRAVAGEKTAFAYSDDISEAALLDAARTVRAIAAAGRSGARQGAGAARSRRSRSLYAPSTRSPRSTARPKVALLEKVEQLARATRSARRAGDGRPGRRVRRGAGRARRRHARRRRAAAGAPVGHGDRRAERPARAGLRGGGGGRFGLRATSTTTCSTSYVDAGGQRRR